VKWPSLAVRRSLSEARSILSWKSVRSIKDFRVSFEAGRPAWARCRRHLVGARRHRVRYAVPARTLNESDEQKARKRLLSKVKTGVVGQSGTPSPPAIGLSLESGSKSFCVALKEELALWRTTDQFGLGLRLGIRLRPRGWELDYIRRLLDHWSALGAPRRLLHFAERPGDHPGRFRQSITHRDSVRSFVGRREFEFKVEEVRECSINSRIFSKSRDF
jgi:hypothetical protein